MAIFIDRLESKLKEKNCTQSELANQIGIRRPTISEWKKNGSIPSGDVCLRIADYLNVSVRWLISGQEEKQLSNQDKELLAKINDLTPAQKESILMMIDGYTLKNKSSSEKLFG